MDTILFYVTLLLAYIFIFFVHSNASKGKGILIEQNEQKATNEEEEDSSPKQGGKFEE